MAGIVSRIVERLKEFQLSWEPKQYDTFDIILYGMELFVIGYAMIAQSTLLVSVLRTRLITVLTKTIIINKWISINGYLVTRLAIVLFPSLDGPEVVRGILLLVVFITFQTYYTSVVFVALVARISLSFPLIFKGAKLLFATTFVIVGMWGLAISIVICITLYPQFGSYVSIFHMCSVILGITICHKVLNQSSVDYKVNAVGDLKRKHQAGVNIRSVRILSLISVVTTFYTAVSLCMLYGVVYLNIKSEIIATKLPRINNILFDIVEGSLATYLLLHEPALSHNSRVIRHFTSVKNVLGIKIYTANTANDHFDQLKKQWMNWS